MIDGDHVHPTRDDPVVAALSEGVGGPVGERAGRHPWWTPVRVRARADRALLRARAWCRRRPASSDRGRTSDVRYAHMCYSDLPYLYTGRGLAELDWPYSDDEQVRDRYEVMEYPVGIAYCAWGAAWVTHWLNGSPGPRARATRSRPATSPPTTRCAREIRALRRASTRVGFAALALLAAWLLTQVNPRRPWDAALVRAVTGARADRADQLGPARGRAGRRRAVGVGARPAGADRRPDRPRHRHQALPAVPARRAPGDLPARPAATRPSRGRRRRGGGGLGGGQPAGVPHRHASSGRCSGRSTPTAAPTSARSGWCSRRPRDTAVDADTINAGVVAVLRRLVPRRAGARAAGARRRRGSPSSAS